MSTGQTTMETCVYCGTTGHDVSGDPPGAKDDAAWAALAKGHKPDCEWVLTRAHRVDEDQAALEEAVRASGGLLYGRKRMKMEPASNTDMNGIAATLRAHQPVMVRLEPGDATRYDLLITPCSATEVRYGMWAIGVPPEKASQYIHVCQPRRGSAFVRMHPRLAPWDLEELDQNEWSRKLLAWWLGRLSELVLAD